MKKIVVITLALALAASAAFAALGSVIASFRAPANFPLALARPTNVTYLWVFTQTSPYNIYRVHGDTGSVYSSYVSFAGSSTRGLSYDWASTLWVGNSSNDYVYNTYYPTGSIRASFPANHDVSGLAVEGGAGGSNPQAIWCSTGYSPYGVWRHHLTSGSIYMSFNPARPACDLAWDYTNNLVWGGSYSNHYVYGYTTTGSLAASFPSPANYPWGLCYYNRVLWVAVTTPVHYIYKIDCPINVNIAPSSIGKIKAMYE